jgi:SAM-dependent methyltransferase
MQGLTIVRFLFLWCFAAEALVLSKKSSIHHGRPQESANCVDSQDNFGLQATATRRKILAHPMTAMIGVALAGPLFYPPPPSCATTLDTKTGIRLPDPGEIEVAVPQDWNDIENPFDDKSQFSRLDNSPDSNFYQDARFVEHVDQQAVQLMTDYISNVAIPNQQKSNGNITVLDLCSSWVSHIDKNAAAKVQRISGLGMNAQELQENPILTDFVVQDLNANPSLPYSSNTFDIVLCQLSIDYLTRPLEVLKEVSRILKPGGTVHILFSNRLFLSKAVSGWTGGDDIDHAYTVACYLHFSGGQLNNIQAQDLSVRKKGRVVGDPMYVVLAVKTV